MWNLLKLARVGMVALPALKGEEDLPGGVNPDLEVQELLRIRLDVELNTLIVDRE